MYLSPFQLLQIPAQKLPQIELSHIRYAKKKWLAEFELHERPSLNLQAKQVDKGQVLALLEELEDEHLRAHHAFIYQQKALHDFLVEGKTHLFSPAFLKQLRAAPQMNRDFIDFLAPYFCEQYRSISLQAFKSRDWEKLSALEPLIEIMPTRHHKDCYIGLLRHLKVLQQALNQYVEKLEKGSKPDHEITDLYDEVLIDLLNWLPDYFQEMRDQYGRKLEELAISLHNQHKRTRLAKIVVKQALKLQLSADVRERLEHLRTQIEQISPSSSQSIFEGIGASTNSGNGGCGLRTLLGFAFISLFLILYSIIPVMI